MQGIILSEPDFEPRFLDVKPFHYRIAQSAAICLLLPGHRLIFDTFFRNTPSAGQGGNGCKA